jgi:hypothetical protein
MMPNASQYSPQGLMNPFAGLQAAGSPYMSPGLFGQPGPNGPYGPFGADSAQAGQSQQYPFGGQTNPFLQNPFTQSQFQSPFATNPYLQSQQWQGSPVNNPFLNSFAGLAGAHHPAQHVIALLAQLAQHLSVHAVITQQIGTALHQLTQQLAWQLYAGAGQGLSAAGQPYAGAGPPFGFGGPFAASPGAAQYFGQNPFAGAQGGYAQSGWAANRPQTIQ